MPMPIAKARQVLKEYKDSDFNASKALVKAGYTKKTATHQSKAVIDSAVKRVITHDMEEIVKSGSPKDALLGYLNISAEDVAYEFIKIIKQDKDLSTKLKALMPLLALKGITWNEDSNKTIAPSLNITVKEVVIEPDNESVAQSTLLDTVQVDESIVE